MMINHTQNSVSIRFMENTQHDMSMLLSWLSNPDVLQYVYAENAPWNIEKIRDEFSEKATGESSVVACMIMYQDREIGYIQYYPIEEDSYKFNDQSLYEQIKGGYGVDMFIGEPELWQKGIGSQALNILEDHFRKALNVHIICVDPATDNERGTVFWRSVGFEIIDIIENYDDFNAKSLLMTKKLKYSSELL